MDQALASPESDDPSTVQLSEGEVEAIWSLDALSLPREQAELVPELFKWLGRRRDNPLADYLVGKPVVTLAKQDSQTITADAISRFRPQSRGIAAVHVITKVIDLGNGSGLFNLCPPPIATLIRRRPSPFAADRWPMLDVATRLRSTLEDTLLSPHVLKRHKIPPPQLARLVIGELLLSAIVHGGLVDASLLESLAEKLTSDEPVVACLGGHLYVDLSLKWKGQPNAEFRRWFPDALTAVLLLQLESNTARIALSDGKTGAHPGRKFLWRCIRTYLKHAQVDRRIIPRSLAKLLDAVRLDMETRIPIVLANYAAREVVSHSLKPHVWQRLHGLAHVSSATEIGSETGLGAPGRGPQSDIEVASDPEPRWLAGLRTAMRHSSYQDVAIALDQLKAKFPIDFAEGSPGKLFADFAYRLTTVANDNKVRLSLSTARAYVFSAAKRIGGLLGADTITDLGTEEWIGLYEEVLGDAENVGMRRKLIRVLREFQRYRESDLQAEPINASEIFGISNGLVPVDANLISPAEFEKIRERFEQEVATELDSEIAESAWLILTLAYRCGLRRMEVLKLDISDVLIESPAELLVRPTEARRLKTKSSTRKLPLYALLETEDLTRLSKWLTKRKEYESKHFYSRFLFAAPNRAMVFISQDTMFRTLHRVMREVTGDATLRFHHLRHTFATRTCLTLLATNVPDPTRLSNVAPWFAAEVASATNFRERLFGTCKMTRRDVWAVASLLGHSGPDVSLEHYIHLLDICLAAHLDQEEIRPRTRTVTAASRLSTTHVYRQSASTDGFDPNRIAVQLWQRRYPQSPSKPQEVSLSPPKSTVVDPHSDGDRASESILRIWRLLFLHSTGRLDLDSLGERWGFDRKQFEEIVHRAEWMAALRITQNGKIHRHRFSEWIRDKRHPQGRVRTLCPTKPHERRDQEIVRFLAPRMRDVYKNHKSLSDKVLKHFAMESRPDFSGMIFADPNQPVAAQEFMEWLKLMGFKPKELRFIRYDQAKERSPVAAAWKRALKLRPDHPFDQLPPRNGRRNWNCQWIGIEPVWPDERGQPAGTPALRFLMVMFILVTGTYISVPPAVPN
jgi:integrase